MAEIRFFETKLTKWQEEIAIIEQRITQDRARLSQLQDRVRVFRDVLQEETQGADEQPERTDHQTDHKAEPDTAFAGLRQGEAMLAILKTMGKPLNGQQIRESLAERGYPIEKWGVRNSYFYAVARTLMERDQVIKTDDGRYTLAPMPERNGEQGSFVDTVMETSVFGARKLAHRKCVDEASAIEFSGTVMPDGTPARKGVTCHKCGEELEWREQPEGEEMNRA